MAGSKNGQRMSLETEVIVAIVILYVGICGAMLAIHWLQPAGQETQTSSTSPSHDHFDAEGPDGERSPLSEADAAALLARNDYRDIRNLRLTDDGAYAAAALKNGEGVRVRIDPNTRAISDQPIE